MYLFVFVPYENVKDREELLQHVHRHPMISTIRTVRIARHLSNERGISAIIYWYLPDMIRCDSPLCG